MKKAVHVALTMFLAGLLAACGSGSTPATSPATPPGEEPSEPAEPSGRRWQVLFRPVNSSYDSNMSNKPSEEPLLQELRQALPADLAREAETCGLLTPESLESLLRTELSRRRRIARFFDAADRLATLPASPLSGADIEAEIRAVRSARRKSDAHSR